MTKIGLIFYAIALAIGLALVIATRTGVFDAFPGGSRIIVIVYAVVILVCRVVLGRRGYLNARRKPDQPDQ